jgi:hypothetical protein
MEGSFLYMQNKSKDIVVIVGLCFVVIILMIGISCLVSNRDKLSLPVTSTSLPTVNQNLPPTAKVTDILTTSLPTTAEEQYLQRQTIMRTLTEIDIAAETAQIQFSNMMNIRKQFVSRMEALNQSLGIMDQQRAQVGDVETKATTNTTTVGEKPAGGPKKRKQ